MKYKCNACGAFLETVQPAAPMPIACPRCGSPETAPLSLVNRAFKLIGRTNAVIFTFVLAYGVYAAMTGIIERSAGRSVGLLNILVAVGLAFLGIWLLKKVWI